MKVINKDATMNALKFKLKEAQDAGNEQMAAITNACLTIIRSMPETDVSEGVLCGECYFYDAKSRRCIHKNGMGGRIRPKMYCSYGSYHRDTVDDDEEEEDNFADFDD